MAQNHIRLQKMVTHNATEVQSFVKDLSDWTSEMSSKEESDQNVTLAEEHKLMGNQMMKEKKYDQAVSSYSDGIKFDPKNAILYANRAQASLFLKKYNDTVNDCTMALTLNTTPQIKSKASFRRAKAYIELNKIDLAKADLEHSIKMDPKGAEAKQMLQDLNRRFGGKAISTGKKWEASKIKRSPSLPPTNYNYSDHDFVEPLKKESDNSEYPKIIHPIEKPPHKQSKRPILPIPVRILGEQPLKRNSLSLPSSKLTSPTIASSQSMDDTGLCSDLEQLNTKEIPPKPATSVQFMLSWKLLREYPTVRAHYLQTLTPSDYEIFKDSMETSTLSEILDVLVWEFLPRKWDFAPHLAGLLKVRRLGTLFMFMPEKDRANARKLISVCDDEDIRKKYIDTFTI